MTRDIVYSFEQLSCDGDDDVDYCAEVWDEYDNYLGMVSHHRKIGKWGTGWNCSPCNSDEYHLDSRDAAVAELKRRYHRHKSYT